MHCEFDSYLNQGAEFLCHGHRLSFPSRPVSMSWEPRISGKSQQRLSGYSVLLSTRTDKEENDLFCNGKSSCLEDLHSNYRY